MRVVKPKKVSYIVALKGASTTIDQDWIDWKSLAEENAAVVISVRELMAPKDYGNGEVAAVRGRVIVLTGSQAGEVFPDETILKAGIRIKLTEVGDDVVGRLDVYGTRKAIGLQAEHTGDIELAERALAKATGKKSTAKKSAPADDDEPPF